MENEMLKVFDENHQPIGQASRAEGFTCKDDMKLTFKGGITYKKLVPHDLSFYQQVAERIQRYLSRK